jgi:hypothetical protein
MGIFVSAVMVAIEESGCSIGDSDGANKRSNLFV